MIMNFQERYRRHLRLAMEWIERSVRPGGGSAAHLAATGLWSRAYPETSGYIINTLLDFSKLSAEPRWNSLAHSLADWLLSIQMKNGAWSGGVHPRKNPAESVFNTGQIILGLVGIYEASNDQRYLESLEQGARWLASTENGAGFWMSGNYRDEFNPTYYTRVAWPMLEAARLTNDTAVRQSAERVLDRLIARRNADGSFADWGFSEGAGAYTHTIAYTLRGFLESGRLLDSQDTFLDAVAPAIERLYRKAEFRQGALPGFFSNGWKGSDTFVCLTGNAQVALLLMRYDANRPDLRLINAACKLVDFVCEKQISSSVSGPFRGAVAGSSPIWGPYLRLRYPNWAAKFFADSLMVLSSRLHKELASER